MRWILRISAILTGLIRTSFQTISMPDQLQKPRSNSPTPGGGGGGEPTAPKVDKPDVEQLLKRMKKVDPDQARKYRQRTGQ